MRSRGAIGAAAIVGLGLILHQAWVSSATYDEVAYLRVAARWYRTGDQAEITRMGSPVLFWKLQQGPTLAVLDALGKSAWIDDPIGHQAELLPWIRAGASWIWLAGLAGTVAWARSLNGDRAGVWAAWIYALSPNLLAHGALVTMELPLVAATAWMLWAFWRFLDSGAKGWFLASAGLAGLAFSCKYTAVIYPPLLGLVWLADRPRAWRRIVLGMPVFGLVMLGANLALTGFATLTLSERVGDHPTLPPGVLGSILGWAYEARWPVDWVGFARQIVHQRSGGPSYLLGLQADHGWWYYYPVALAVKTPPVLGLLVLARLREKGPKRQWLVLLLIGAFLVLAMAGSKRNYGVRYLLPLAPAGIVWLAGLVDGPLWSRRLAWGGLAGYAVAVGTIHPHELTYFNIAAGGPVGGRRILADSNLDWGQGARSLARLQISRPEFRDLTVYAFGDTTPAHYGVVGTIYPVDAHEDGENLPPQLEATTGFLAVSASLQYGPWGPPGYFDELNRLTPVAYSDDTTFALYRTADLQALRGPDSTGRSSR